MGDRLWVMGNGLWSLEPEDRWQMTENNQEKRAAHDFMRFDTGMAAMKLGGWEAIKLLG
jgi:hypothetical protein